MPKPQLEFHDGCFDNFDGTQEELDSLLEELENFLASDQLEEILKSVAEKYDIDTDSVPVKVVYLDHSQLDELEELEDSGIIEHVNNYETYTTSRTIQ